LQLDGKNLQLLGNRPMRLFINGKEPSEYQATDDINFLIQG